MLAAFGFLESFGCFIEIHMFETIGWKGAKVGNMISKFFRQFAKAIRDCH